MSRILIVENDSLVRAALTSQLESSGYACLPTETAAAMAEARRATPASAIVGAEHPDDASMWVVRMFRTQPTPIPVIVLSSTRSADLAASAARLGVSDCLVWPASREIVREAVDRSVQWRHSVDAASQAVNRLRQDMATGRAALIEAVRGLSAEAAPSVLTAILESRAPEIFDHSRRVSRSAASLARALGVPSETAREVRLAGLLHDIGKVALPQGLLSRARPLSDEEVGIVRGHADAGADAVDAIPGHAGVAVLMRRVHKRFDAAGQPGAPVADQAPLGARMIAVADAYDVLTSCRACCDPLTHDEANAELVRSAGRAFDPDLVRTWMRMTERQRCS